MGPGSCPCITSVSPGVCVDSFMPKISRKVNVIPAKTWGSLREKCSRIQKNPSAAGWGVGGCRQGSERCRAGGVGRAGFCQDYVQTSVRAMQPVQSSCPRPHLHTRRVICSRISALTWFALLMCALPFSPTIIHHVLGKWPVRHGELRGAAGMVWKFLICGKLHHGWDGETREARGQRKSCAVSQGKVMLPPRRVC